MSDSMFSYKNLISDTDFEVEYLTVTGMSLFLRIWTKRINLLLETYYT